MELRFENIVVLMMMVHNVSSFFTLLPIGFAPRSSRYHVCQQFFFAFVDYEIQTANQ